MAESNQRIWNIKAVNNHYDELPEQMQGLIDFPIQRGCDLFNILNITIGYVAIHKVIVYILQEKRKKSFLLLIMYAHDTLCNKAIGKGKSSEYVKQLKLNEYRKTLEMKQTCRYMVQI